MTSSTPARDPRPTSESTDRLELVWRLPLLGLPPPQPTGGASGPPRPRWSWLVDAIWRDRSWVTRGVAVASAAAAAVVALSVFSGGSSDQVALLNVAVESSDNGGFEDAVGATSVFLGVEEANSIIIRLEHDNLVIAESLAEARRLDYTPEATSACCIYV